MINSCISNSFNQNNKIVLKKSTIVNLRANIDKIQTQN
jgi:hypothetical protein